MRARVFRVRESPCRLSCVRPAILKKTSKRIALQTPLMSKWSPKESRFGVPPTCDFYAAQSNFEVHSLFLDCMHETCSQWRMPFFIGFSFIAGIECEGILRPAFLIKRLAPTLFSFCRYWMPKRALSTQGKCPPHITSFSGRCWTPTNALRQLQLRAIRVKLRSSCERMITGSIFGHACTLRTQCTSM